MPIKVNLRHLEEDDVHLDGELPAEELELDTADEAIHANNPLKYDLNVQQMEQSILVQGDLEIDLDCECVRCLRPFKHKLKISPWTLHLELQGDEAVTVSNDCVDLTPYVREDILLEFPQHPLCNQESCGLPNSSIGKGKKASNPGQNQAGASAWAELNKLKL
jgi:uncharacterized protein